MSLPFYTSRFSRIFFVFGSGQSGQEILDTVATEWWSVSFVAGMLQMKDDESTGLTLYPWFFENFFGFLLDRLKPFHRSGMDTGVDNQKLHESLKSYPIGKIILTNWHTHIYIYTHITCMYCIVLCCVVLYCNCNCICICIVLYCIVLYGTYVLLCCVMSCYAMLRSILLCYLVICYVMLCDVCNAMQCHAMYIHIRKYFTNLKCVRPVWDRPVTLQWAHSILALDGPSTAASDRSHPGAS